MFAWAFQWRSSCPTVRCSGRGPRLRAAVGIGREGAEQRLAYISLRPSTTGSRYYVALENPPRPGSDVPYENAGERDDPSLPSPHDHWWEVDEATNVDILAREVADAIVEYGLPFFDGFKSASSMLLHLRSGDALPGLMEGQRSLVHAILAADAGARDEAREVLTRIYSGTDVASFRETVREIFFYSPKRGSVRFKATAGIEDGDDAVHAAAEALVRALGAEIRGDEGELHKW
jgi:hypothetical protein